MRIYDTDAFVIKKQSLIREYEYKKQNEVECGSFYEEVEKPLSEWLDEKYKPVQNENNEKK